MVLGQVSTEEKSNEITAIPKLLECLDINGCIVTIDAMGAQKEIAKDVVDKGAHYVLGLKGNQGLLADAVERHFKFASEDERKQASLKFHEETEKNGGRVETRRIWVSDASRIVDSLTQEWSCLTSIAKVEAIRSTDGQESLDHRYYISSLPGDDAAAFAKAIRSHWAIENQLHWTLDVVFNEDQCRVRKDHAAENMAVVRHIALGLHNKHGREVQINGKTRKTGLANRRQLASWHQAYREKLLGLLAEIT
jgi:predicted transposase YbfD/YdcC